MSIQRQCRSKNVRNQYHNQHGFGPGLLNVKLMTFQLDQWVGYSVTVPGVVSINGNTIED